MEKRNIKLVQDGCGRNASGLFEGMQVIYQAIGEGVERTVALKLSLVIKDRKNGNQYSCRLCRKRSVTGAG